MRGKKAYDVEAFLEGKRNLIQVLGLLVNGVFLKEKKSYKAPYLRKRVKGSGKGLRAQRSRSMTF